MMLQSVTERSEIRVNPSQRLAFLESQLSDHGAIRLVITEAADAKSKEPKGPFAHALTIERYGKGFRVQDIVVNSDGAVSVGEHLITRRGRYVEIPGARGITETTNLSALLEDRKPRAHSPQHRYRNFSADALLDRLIIQQDVTNDTRKVEPNRAIEVRKREFDTHLRDALGALGTEEVAGLIKTNSLPHPLKSAIDMLLPLAKSRAAQVQLATTLNHTGLAGFTFSGNDMM